MLLARPPRHLPRRSSSLGRLCASVHRLHPSTLLVAPLHRLRPLVVASGPSSLHLALSSLPQDHCPCLLTALPPAQPLSSKTSLKSFGINILHPPSCKRILTGMSLRLDKQFSVPRY
ncbi:hypothetical protein PTTG_10682 [Puccinia triticina 1-1 BBBD Race 1]|uniref:Uncharacterized protein n=1 Tax=Puccinia triticina (isolate 1-1 / race 1 (BBBD)) TaxID=630390 RepID=A0A180FZW4_PUCT1|nr:hypothetical protein PTTG_10682 [Puccinia triticina 1-1 BBBD Race 1]